MTNVYYLSHGGPGSGRYPLGSGDRPYQKFEGTGGKPRGIVGYIKEKKRKKAEEQEQKRLAEYNKKLLEAAEIKRKMAANKEKVLRSGKAGEVLAYQGQLTNKELQDAYNRIDFEDKLARRASQDVVTTSQKIDKIMKNVDTVTNWANTGIKAYNTLASIYNSTADGKRKPLSTIKVDGGGKK